MGIKFRCPECDKKIHVKSYLAGKKGMCPKCNASVQIPSAGGTADDDGEADDIHTHQPGEDAIANAPTTITPARPSDPFAEDPTAQWYVRYTNGSQYGPTPPEEFRQWVDQGRVTADCLVWRDGWPEWLVADKVFPKFSAPAVSPPVAPKPVAPKPAAPQPVSPPPAALMPPSSAVPHMPAVPQMPAMPQMPQAPKMQAPMAAPVSPMPTYPLGNSHPGMSNQPSTPTAAIMPHMAPALAHPQPMHPLAGAPMAAVAPGFPMPGVAQAPQSVPMAAVPRAMPVGHNDVIEAPIVPDGGNSSDTMELLKSVNRPSSGTGGGSYYAPRKSNDTAAMVLLIGGAVLLVVLVPIMLYQFMAEPDTGGTILSQNNSGQTVAWKPFENRGENFTIQFPIDPVQAAENDQTIAGRVAGTKFTSDHRARSGYVYSLSVCRIPDVSAATNNMQQFLDESGTAAAGYVRGGRASGGSPVSAGRLSGREYLVDNVPTKMRIRVFVADGRRYTLAVIDDRGQGLNSNVVNSFFSSFRLLQN